MTNIGVEFDQGAAGTDPWPVTIPTLPVDIFANLIIGQRDNQIEVHFDDVNYADYLSHTVAGGGSGGTRAQSNGQVRYSTGTATTGRSQAITLDVIKYRPFHETYAAWTAAFITAGVASSWQRVGLFDATNGVFTGYEGTSFGITYRLNGSDTHVAQASWLDPCDGTAGSAFTRDGVPEALDPSKLQVYRVRIGWLGSAGFIMEVMSPDWTWVPIYELKRPNQADVPFFTNADLAMSLDVGKSAGATNFVVATNCWAGGTTSDKARLSDPITDRTLAMTTRSVITGKTTAGGGSYVDVKVNPSGSIETNALTDTQLRAAEVDTADSGEREYTHVPFTVTASGDTTIYTPAAGMRVRVRSISAINDPTASSPIIIKVFVGTTEKHRGWVITKRQRFTGGINEALKINLSASGTVVGTAVLEEV